MGLNLELDDSESRCEQLISMVEHFRALFYLESGNQNRDPYRFLQSHCRLKDQYCQSRCQLKDSIMAGRKFLRTMTRPKNMEFIFVFESFKKVKKHEFINFLQDD
eukprot:UN11644